MRPLLQFEYFILSLTEKFLDAETNWRNFILGQSPHPNKNTLHFLYGGYFDNFNADELPANWNTFIQRAVERDLIYTPNGRFIATYVKTGPLIFIGKINDEDNILGKEHIRCKQWPYPSHPFDPSPAIWNLLKNRSKGALEILGKISDKQAQKSEAQIMSDPSKFTNSGLAQTMQQDFKQFGPKKK